MWTLAACWPNEMYWKVAGVFPACGSAAACFLLELPERRVFHNLAPLQIQGPGCFRFCNMQQHVATHCPLWKRLLTFLEHSHVGLLRRLHDMSCGQEAGIRGYQIGPLPQKPYKSCNTNLQHLPQLLCLAQGPGTSDSSSGSFSLYTALIHHSRNISGLGGNKQAFYGQWGH